MLLECAGAEHGRVNHLFYTYGLTGFPAFNAALVGQGFVTGTSAIHAPRFFPCGEKERHFEKSADLKEVFAARFLIPV